MNRYAISVAVLAVTGSVCAQAVQWTEAEGGNGHWYQFTWLQTGCIDFSVDQAAQLGAHLVTVTSNEENMFIEPLIPNYNGGYSVARLGGFRTPESGNPEEGWYWITGETWDFTAWSPHNDQPNDAGGIDEDWLTLYPSQHSGGWAGWHDSSGIECDNNEGEQAWIIEWSADCNDDGIVDYGQIRDGTYADDDGNGVPDCCDAGTPCDAPANAPVQWTEADGGNGHWYQATLAREISWPEADQAASDQGGYLATMTSAAENQLLATTAPLIDGNGPGWWLGGLYDHNLSQWTWISGEPWEYTSWGNSSVGCGATQPDGRDAVDFYCLDTDGTPRWSDDFLVWNSSVGYVIEWSADCNGDDIVDYGQIRDGSLEDLNENGVPDCCELPGACEDCNDNGVLDSEDLANGTSQDCNTNGVPDECDIADGTSSDCNANSIPDECESLADCDGDGTSDACEILDGALDMNPADGVPDECQGLPAGACCVNGACMMGTAANCFAAEGSYAGDGVSCIDANCPPACLGDLVPDGVVDINDVLVILSEFGSVCP